MNKTKKPIMRLISWVATWLMIMLVEQASRLVCGIGQLAVDIVDEWSTIAIIATAIIFGSLYLSLYFYSAIMAGTAVVLAAEYLYPTKKGARYWAFSIYEILGCLFFVLMGILGTVKGGSMFWFYAKYLWLAIFSVVFLTSGLSKPNS